MSDAGTDIYYLIETVLLCAIPFALMAAGILLRRKFTPAAPAESGEAPQQTGGRRAARFLGTFLLWSGILSLIFCGIVLLNYLGVL